MSVHVDSISRGPSRMRKRAPAVGEFNPSVCVEPSKDDLTSRYRGLFGLIILRKLRVDSTSFACSD